MTPERLRTTICLGTGAVMHARRPVGGQAGAASNVFHYPYVFMTVPLSMWGRTPTAWLGFDRRAPVALLARDHGARDGQPPLLWLRTLLAREGFACADGEIVLQTTPRVFGLVFNPVSFWFCHDGAGELRAVLAAVNNTFGERHNYLLAHPDQRPIADGDTLVAWKVFHVSPFYPVCGEYRFRFHLRDDCWRAVIDYFIDDQRALATAVTARPVPLSRAGLMRLTFTSPLLAVAVLARIHWQALRLWFAGALLFRKPAPPLQETSR